jgi:hypothetical protein
MKGNKLHCKCKVVSVIGGFYRRDPNKGISSGNLDQPVTFLTCMSAMFVSRVGRGTCYPD